MSYEEWMTQVPEAIRKDPVWGFYGYRKALFLFDLAWHDCALVMKDLRGRSIVSQLIDAVGSISANTEEGIGRGFGKDHDRFVRIAIGSARESKGWYFRARHLMSQETTRLRLALIDEVISLLIDYLNRHRERKHS